MDLRESNNRFQETIALPVKYDNKQQTIWDSKGMMVCDIREWGRTQFRDKSKERQDAIGKKIAKLLNEAEAEADQTEFQDEETKETKTFPSTKKVVLFELD